MMTWYLEMIRRKLLEENNDSNLWGQICQSDVEASDYEEYYSSSTVIGCNMLQFVRILKLSYKYITPMLCFVF